MWTSLEEEAAAIMAEIARLEQIAVLKGLDSVGCATSLTRVACVGRDN
jgi:hypothetical protein